MGVYDSGELGGRERQPTGGCLVCSLAGTRTPQAAGLMSCKKQRAGLVESAVIGLGLGLEPGL